MPEDAVLESAEGMLHRTAAELHERRCCALVHSLKRIFVKQSEHLPLRGCGAAYFLCACTAVPFMRPVADRLVLLRNTLAPQDMLSRTYIDIEFRVVLESVAVEEGTAALGIWIAYHRYMGQDASFFAMRRLFAIRVTCIRNDVQALDAECDKGSFCHRFELPLTARVQTYIVRNNQGVFRIDRHLHVISRSIRSRYGHETNFRFGMSSEPFESGLNRSWIDRGLLLLVGCLHAIQIPG